MPIWISYDTLPILGSGIAKEWRKTSIAQDWRSMQDERLFRQVYEDHIEMVYNLCLNYLQNAEDAEEVSQDVFVKVHTRMAKFAGRSSLKTWIYRIAVNQCLDHLKAQKRQKRFGIHVSIFPFGTSNPVLAGNFRHPGVQLEDKEATERIFRHINELPPKQKTALILKSLENLSQQEIAEVMKMSVKAVESLLSRARANLKKKLKQSEG